MRPHTVFDLPLSAPLRRGYLFLLGVLLLAISVGVRAEDALEIQQRMLDANALVRDAETVKDCEWAYRRMLAAGYYREGKAPQMERSDIYRRCTDWLQVKVELRRTGR